MPKKFIYEALACAILATVSLFAQQPGSPLSPPTPAQMVANRVARLTVLLNLTTAQQTQATAVFTTEQNAVSGLLTSLQTAHSTLQTAIQSNDTAAINTQATLIGNLTTQQVEAGANAEAAFYAILTADQQAKYKQLLSTGFGRLGGFGGPGPQHPPMP
jgi:Spy/CpxP family protein refolding chaperone